MSEMRHTGRATRRVSRWVSLYTRGLPRDVVFERKDELTSDLYEHAAQRNRDGMQDQTIAKEIQGRAVRGMAADLLWRDGRMRQFRARRFAAMTVRELRSTQRLSWLVYSVGIVVSGVGLVASVRATTNVSIYGNASMGIPIFVAAALAVLSLSLTLRVASRAAGVTLLVVSCVLLNWYMLAASTNLSSRAVALLVRNLAFLPRPLIMVVLLLPTVLVSAALVLILRKLHRIEQHPAQ